MEKGAAQAQARQLTDAIATYSEVVRRKPGFAEGWNRRATARFLARDFKRSLEVNPNLAGIEESIALAAKLLEKKRRNFA